MIGPVGPRWDPSPRSREVVRGPERCWPSRAIRIVMPDSALQSRSRAAHTTASNPRSGTELRPGSTGRSCSRPSRDAVVRRGNGGESDSRSVSNALDPFSEDRRVSGENFALFRPQSASSSVFSARVAGKRIGGWSRRLPSDADFSAAASALRGEMEFVPAAYCTARPTARSTDAFGRRTWVLIGAEPRREAASLHRAPGADRATTQPTRESSGAGRWAFLWPGGRLARNGAATLARLARAAPEPPGLAGRGTPVEAAHMARPCALTDSWAGEGAQRAPYARAS